MIDRDTMRNLQELSRLRLEEEEKRSLAEQLEEILQYFSLLARYDTSGVDVDLGDSLAPDELRDDCPGESVGREQIESFAVEFEDGQFVVPRILGDGEHA